MSGYRHISLALTISTALALAATSCTDERVSSYAANIEPRMWNERATLIFDNVDTLSQRDLSLFVKHQPQAKLDSLNIRIYITSPDFTIHRDLITIPLHNEVRGRRGMAKVNSMPYREGVVWSQKGRYIVDIYPVTPVAGVEAVGLKIHTL